VINAKILVFSFALCAFIPAQAQVDSLMGAMKSGSGSASGLPLVRESILRESAVVYGAREGLRIQSCLIMGEIEKQRADLDRRFRFGDLMIGKGILPPAISEARDSVSLESTVMRVAKRVYHFDENVRIVDVPPTWRDWLLVGLTPDSCGGGPIDAPDQDQLKPQTPQEEAFFRGVLQRSYDMGVQQAREVLEANLARLERTYFGMRRYFELYARGMVSAPMIATSTDVLVRDDPNTLVVGNAVIRIMVPVDFVEKSDQWKPLGE
jgi:defect-in-organelle-trafficking protein DotC